MAVWPSPPPAYSTGPLRGYSDFFASGFRAVSTGVRRRPTSLYSTTSDTDTNDEVASPPTVPSIMPNVLRHGRLQRQRRPLSMMISSSAQSKPVQGHSRRSSIVAFSSRLFDRIPFAFGDENATSTVPASSSGGKTKSRRFSRILGTSTNTNEEPRPPADLWVTTGGPHTPSVPNGEPDLPATLDPFGSSPDSKSFFIDLSSDSSTSDVRVLKRESFLSMTTTSNSSTSISLFHLPRRDRPISIQTMPALPTSPPSRRSSFQCRGQIQEKRDSWIMEEEEGDPILIPEYISGDYESRDDAAQIDWRQFHNELLTVEEM